MDHRIVEQFKDAVGPEAVLTEPVQLVTYECDALPHLRSMPELVLLPRSAADVQAIVRICNKEGVPFVARGHGTGLSGGALPVPGGVVISLAKLNRVLDVDIPNRRVTVEPGVTNLEITRQVAPFGYYYAPDPSSQQVCSIGGNIAENSGGAHCLKYGFTVHHILAVEAVLTNGDLVQIGSPLADAPGPDVLGLLIGSEGTLAIVTKAVVRILRKPESVQTLLAAFDSISEAGSAVSEIISAGIVPAAVEMMDAVAIEAAEAAVHPNFPPADTVLIVELDGPSAEVAELFTIVEAICQKSGATQVEVAQDEAQRGRIWKGRKAAFAAMGRISPNYYVQDGVVPRTKLPEVLGRIRAARRARGPSHRQCVPCRRRQSASADLLRRAHRRAVGAGGASRGRDPALLRRGRRIDHRRARCRRRQERVHAEDVLAGQPRRDAVGARRARSEALVQSRQSPPDTQALWGSARSVSRTSRRARRTR